MRIIYTADKHKCYVDTTNGNMYYRIITNNPNDINRFEEVVKTDEMIITAPMIDMREL